MKLRLKYFALEFTNREDEKRFRELNQNLQYIRLILIISSLIYAAFLPVDYIFFKEYFSYCIIIRLGVLTLLGIILASTYTRIFLRNRTAILILLCIAAALSISLIQYVAGDTEAAGIYFFGVAQVLIFLFGFGKISAFPALYTGLFISVSAITVDGFFIDQNPHIMILKSLFLISFVFMGFFISYLIELTARRNFLYREELENLSWTDALTGLHNRHFFYRFIRDDLNRFLSGKDSDQSRMGTEDTLCIILLDIDDFKLINDKHGHEAGDMVLKKIGEERTELSRRNDDVIRWGGEEFLIILNNINSRNIYSTVKRITKSLSDKPISIGINTKIPVTLSGGMAAVSKGINPPSEDFKGLFNLIDQALYKSKTSGKDCIYEVQPGSTGNECLFTLIK